MLNIKFSRIITCALCCAFFAVLYVHQEVEIVKTGFSINRKRTRVTLLLDQHRSLVYNLSRLESPKRVEDALSMNEITLCMPKIENIQRLQRIEQAYTISRESKPARSWSLLANVIDRFSQRAEAEVAN